jgi:hypothetical protein
MSGRKTTLVAFVGLALAACGSGGDDSSGNAPPFGGTTPYGDDAQAPGHSSSSGGGPTTPPPPPPPPGSPDGGAGDAAAGTDASSPADDGGPMKGWKPTAKGLWIWYFDYVGMTAAQAADKAKAAGVGYVLIKSSQDGSFWSTRYTAAAVSEFTSRGMRVLAWPYITPAGGAAAITAAAQAANVPGTSGLVLDVEIEWEQGGDHSADAKTLCEGIRAKVPGIWLGYTSFGWVGYHTGFPFKSFDTYCGDSAWPQVYYSDRGVTWNGTSGLSQAVSMYKAAGLTAPFWPIQSNDDVYNTTAGPTTADLNGFFDQAGAYSSLWEFPASGLTTKLNQLPSLNWKNP